ncbi:MAG: hypothetical protein QF632_06120 [Candidatus Woesearchaeota archaeon]|jgi:hypothetical protein|nr:hypothetical protein [Candidatus Woesearchaeota archaeon]MDP7324309.1 hypothetical protein [Candidatus Woesearchaeota archaeon]MDP7458498.1 hypothetical protein [Candidatus Woesearchaeota archaeon]
MKKLIVLLIVCVALFVGCQSEDEASAKIINAYLKPDIIQSGESADLIIDAKNKGKIATTVTFNVTTEAPDRVEFEYPIHLAYPLQPGETTGNKIVKVTGVSDTVRTDYAITIMLTDTSGNEIFDQEDLILTVKKK